jgi:Sap, sulfolipid-1-addressing protein
MLSALGQLLPIAIAVAVSSFPIMVTILILLSPRRNRVAIPFLIGWVVGMAGVVIVAAYGANALPIRPLRAEQKSIGIAEIVVGVALLLIALLAWRRAAPGPEEGQSRWFATVERMGPVAAVGVAIVLNLRPKGLLLGVAAGLAIAGARMTDTDRVIAFCIYLAVACSTVMVPIILTLVAPTQMQPRLISARDWLQRNGGYVTAVVLLVVGLVILASGLTRL